MHTILKPNLIREAILLQLRHLFTVSLKILRYRRIVELISNNRNIKQFLQLLPTVQYLGKNCQIYVQGRVFHYFQSKPDLQRIARHDIFYTLDMCFLSVFTRRAHSAFPQNANARFLVRNTDDGCVCVETQSSSL